MVGAPSLSSCLEAELSLEGLLGLIYVLPVGIAKFRADGSIDLINPLASEALLRIGDDTLSNIYTALSRQIPDLRSHVLGFAGASGRIAGEIQLLVGSKLFGLNIHKLDELNYLAILQDASELAKLSRRLKEDSAKQKRQEEKIRVIGMHFSDALNNISQGVRMFDSHQRIIVASRRFCEIYRLTQDQVRPGTTLRQILEKRQLNGTYFGQDADIYVLHNPTLKSEIHRLSYGRVIAIARQRLPHGGWVATHEDIGVTMAQDCNVTSHDLLKQADLALYRAKSEKRGCYSFFSTNLIKEAEAERSLEVELGEALNNKEFELHYQTIFAADSCEIAGVEALVRWRHPKMGLVPPDQFIPLAEETGLIVPLGEWILQRACEDAAKWPEHIKIAVNLSAVQFRARNLFDVILCALAESGLNPRRLELEITESVLLGNEDDYMTTIRQLKNIGVSFALDDFGTGYSSLSYLTRFPFDKIKIDKSFIRGFGMQKSCDAIVSSVIVLARGLNIATTAEGVETEEQHKLLRGAGVDFLQGYLFARPVLPIELKLSRWRSPDRASQQTA